MEEPSGIYIPTPETKSNAYQEDKFGNFRIVVREEESDWIDTYDGIASLKIDGELFIGVSPYWGDILPSGCVLKIQKADEDGDTDFYSFKISDLYQDIVLDSTKIEDLLRESGSYVEGDYNFSVKHSKREGFVKIRIIEFAVPGREGQDKTLNEEEVKDFLIDTFDPCNYDVIDIQENKIN